MKIWLEYLRILKNVISNNIGYKFGALHGVMVKLQSAKWELWFRFESSHLVQIIPKVRACIQFIPHGTPQFWTNSVVPPSFKQVMVFSLKYLELCNKWVVTWSCHFSETSGLLKYVLWTILRVFFSRSKMSLWPFRFFQLQELPIVCINSRNIPDLGSWRSISAGKSKFD